MILVGAHYLPFTTLYGMRMFVFLGGILMAAGIAVAEFFPRSFSLGAWIAGVALLVFAWIGRSVAMREAGATVTAGASRTT